MKKILIALFTFLLVFVMCPQDVLASEQKTYDNLADLSTDDDKKDYFVWHDKTDDHIYILFWSNVFNLSNTWEGDDRMYDYYGIGFITDDLINFTKTEAVWDKYNTTYKNDKTNIEFIYSTKEIKNTSTDTVFLTAGYQSSYTPSDDDKKDDTEDDNSGLLSSLWNTVKDIFKSIGEGFNNVINGISNLWLNLKTALSGWFNDVIENIKNIPSALADWFNDIIEHIKNIPDLILSGIKSLFVPEEGYLDEKLESLEKKYLGMLGFSVEDFENTLKKFSDEKAIDDVVITYNIGGVQKEITILDTSFLVYGVDFMRPYVRGFIVLLMCFFALDQIMYIAHLNKIDDGEGHISVDMGGHTLDSSNKFRRVK